MEDFLQRTKMLLGEEAVKRLASSHIAVFGLGGVGGHVCEALARSGVGAMDLIDADIVAESNLNRQIIALRSTIGRDKVEVMRERLLDINPDLQIRTHKTFFLPETAEEFDFAAYDYVIDAIDTVAGKIELAVRCTKSGTPLIASMGTGNKLHPECFQIADIYETSVCPLARVMRTQLRKRGVKQLKVLYSKEPPLTPCIAENGGRVPGSTAFSPSVAGLLIASEVVRDLIDWTDR